MKARYQLRNSTHFIEFPHTPEGYALARVRRANFLSMKVRRIRSIIQAYPSEVKIDTLITLT